MKKLKHIKSVNEYYSNSLTEQELLEMANIGYKKTGIENVILWVGPNPASHGKRIKISNTPNKFDGHDCFTLTLPDFEIIGDVKIPLKTIDKIKEWCTLNMSVIIDYSDYKILTEDFLDQIKPL